MGRGDKVRVYERRSIRHPGPKVDIMIPNMSTNPFKFPLSTVPPTADVLGGSVREAKKKTFPALNGLAVFYLELHPGGVRIPHWHPDANELDYILHGKARIAMVGPDNVKETFDVSAGEISFIPQGWFHSIQNIGDSDLKMLVIFNNDSPNDIGISVGLGGMDPFVLAETLGASPSVFEGFRKDVELIAPQAQ